MCDAIVYPSEENAVYFKFFLDCNFMCLSVKALQVIYEMNIFNTRNSRILGSRRGWEINKIYNARTKPLFCLLFFLRFFIHSIICAKPILPRNVKMSFLTENFWCLLEAKFVMNFVALGMQFQIVRIQTSSVWFSYRICRRHTWDIGVNIYRRIIICPRH